MTNQTPSNSVVTEAMIEAGEEALSYYDGEQTADTVRSIYLAMQSANTKGSDELDPGDPQDWEAYSFMCSLIGYLIAGHELALRVNAIATPDTDVLERAKRNIILRIAKTERDARVSELTDDEINGLAKAAIEAFDAALSQPLGSQENSHGR